MTSHTYLDHFSDFTICMFMSNAVNTPLMSPAHEIIIECIAL